MDILGSAFALDCNDKHIMNQLTEYAGICSRVRDLGKSIIFGEKCLGLYNRF